jgi:hypothetical protein
LQICPIRVQPSLLHDAPSFLLQYFLRGGAPMDGDGRPMNPIIGDFRRNSTGVVDDYRTLQYTLWRPPMELPMAWYSVGVASPSAGNDSNSGRGEEFWIQFPYVWVAGPWQACVLPPGASCGIGVATRTVRVCYWRRRCRHRCGGDSDADVICHVCSDPLP